MIENLTATLMPSVVLSLYPRLRYLALALRDYSIP